MVKEQLENDDEHERVYRTIVDYCRKSGRKFVDDSFPPCDRSLYMNAIDKHRQKSALPPDRRIRWLRPDDIRTHKRDQHLKWTVFNAPKLNDIKQGLLGNCWLLSALAVLIDQIETLERIIQTSEYSHHGLYVIKLCHKGEWRRVLVDDLLPCDTNGCLIYSQANRKQLWVPLIEKAMAKLHGSYESLTAGQTIEALSTLTGYPCESISLEPGDEHDHDYNHYGHQLDVHILWARLLSMKEAGYALGASCGKSNIDDDSIFTSRGLLPRHAYSIINIRDLAGNQLIQLRNPWGRYTWTGDWSENSPKWTAELLNALKSASDSRSQSKHVNDEGVFWMSLDDFLKYFSLIDVCKTRYDWFECRLSGHFAAENSTHIETYHLVVMETCQIDIGLFNRTSGQRHEISNLDLCLAVMNRSTGRLVASSRRSLKKFIQSEHILKPGEYVIVPLSFNLWRSKQPAEHGDGPNFEYNIAVHGSRPFKLEPELHSIRLQAETVIKLCLENGSKTYSGLQGVFIYTLAKFYSGLIVVAENLNDKGYFHIELNCEKSHNVVSTRKSLHTLDSVPPLHRQVIVLLTQSIGYKSFSIQYSIKYRLSYSNPYLNTWPGNEGVYVTNRPQIKHELHLPQSVIIKQT